ncbi:uncharacterized protein LOC135389071 isoform X1 [Ornithodoros turicata]|uniref:uncharacterized protein LOC135389071 isoform X1 n=1 Tax=Ornithodoros turicata TaxID=34597 RepID=UPI00313A0B76
MASALKSILKRFQRPNDKRRLSFAADVQVDPDDDEPDAPTAGRKQSASGDPEPAKPVANNPGGRPPMILEVVRDQDDDFLGGGLAENSGSVAIIMAGACLLVCIAIVGILVGLESSTAQTAIMPTETTYDRNATNVTMPEVTLHPMQGDEYFFEGMDEASPKAPGLAGWPLRDEGITRIGDDDGSHNPDKAEGVGAHKDKV